MALCPAKVTLAVPWLSSHEQAGLFPDSLVFHRPDEQEAYIKKVLGRAFDATWQFAESGHNAMRPGAKG